jgi:hypothetical protein
MKSIKSIKQTKEVELGEIRRVDDKTAYNMVGSMWQYISKTEWKQSISKSKKTEQPVVQDTVQDTDKVEKKPYKKGQKPEKKKNEKNS